MWAVANPGHAQLALVRGVQENRIPQNQTTMALNQPITVFCNMRYGTVFFFFFFSSLICSISIDTRIHFAKWLNIIPYRMGYQTMRYSIQY